MEHFWLTPDDEQTEAERDWTLRSSSGDVVAAELLVGFIAALELLVFRQSRSFRQLHATA